MSHWFADVVNSLEDITVLNMEINEGDRHQGTLYRTESGEMFLEITGPFPVKIPAEWLAAVIKHALDHI